ncbi:arginine--tRNA ligase [bacterium]|nr:arginine--tRNA ligase [bacterium]
MKSHLTEIRNAVLAAVEKAGFGTLTPEEIDLSTAKQKEHGDLGTNVALKLAPRLKQNPRKVAGMILDHLALPEGIDKADVAGPGFINFFLGRAVLYGSLEEILRRNEAYGRSEQGKGSRTQVEFVSANPTGPLTIGHGRQAVIGDTIAKLLEATGHSVTREYYFNDAGRQMRILGDSVRRRYLELAGEAVEFPEDYYQGEYIRDIARGVLQDKGAGLKSESDLALFQNRAEQAIFRDIKATLKRLGIVFDVFYNEKSLYETGKIDKVIKALRGKDLAYDREGAVWFRTSKLGMDQDRVIVKSTGEPTYRLPDIAYHKDKMDRGFDRVIDIFGADHIATYPDVLAGLKALGYDPSRVTVLIHQFVTLTEGREKIKMSTRKANFVTLDELMDEVGPDVTRYFFLNRSMSSHLNFDLTLAKTQSDENPVYYVQYAHARICSIIQHARSAGVDPEAGPDADLGLLASEEELDLIRILKEFPREVSEAALHFEPHRIPAYLEEVANVYHRFQHTGKVDAALRVVTDNIPLTRARLALCRATRIVLANGLDLLGISAPERM